METLDAVFILGYVAFIIFASLVFKRFATDSAGFIRGGGAMMWWMAGATAFMTQFSAWTFTGAAAKAYEDGLTVLFLFWGNAIGFFIAAAFFAARYRKLRVDTPMQVIRVRFGKISEQTFSWISFPLAIISAAIWLNGLAIFVAAVFHVDLYFTILIVGMLVIFIAVSGGSWTVSATNVIQLILLVAITITVGAFALIDIGGPVALVEEYPHNALMGQGIEYWQIFFLWLVFILMQQTLNTNNALTCYRFLVASDEKEARKAALFAGVLFIIGPVMWFIPPWVSATLNIDLQAYYPNLGESANNAAYLFYIEYYMPKGVLGLALAAMIAATISPMTTGLNRNAGIFVRNIYQSVVNVDATEKQQMLMGKLATIVTGVLSILVALMFASVKEYSFFDIMMLFGAFLQMPMCIPSLLALVIIRTPDWSGWVTILVGFCVSAFMHLVFKVDWLLPLFDAQSFTLREAVDLKIISTICAHLLITVGFFITTALFYKEPKGKRYLELHNMNLHINTPIRKDESAKVDKRQAEYLGKMTLTLGALVVIIGLLFGESGERLTFFVISALILFAGQHLYRSGTERTKH